MLCAKHKSYEMSIDNKNKLKPVIAEYIKINVKYWKCKIIFRKYYGYLLMRPVCSVQDKHFVYSPEKQFARL